MVAQRRIALIAAISLASTILSSTLAAKRPSSAGANTGRALYDTAGCASCHGTEGGGSTMSGPALARTQLPFEAFEAQTRQPATSMPPYTEKVLSTSDLQKIYAFLKALPEGPKPAPGKVP